MAHTFNPTGLALIPDFRGQKQADLCEFEVSLAYIVNSRTLKTNKQTSRGVQEETFMKNQPRVSDFMQFSPLLPINLGSSLRSKGTEAKELVPCEST